MAERFDPGLLEQLRIAVGVDPVVTTIADRKPNWIAQMDSTGIWVETEKSKAEGKEPQLVPPWMVQTAWDHLRANGELTNQYLLATDGLNVKRSSFVCALLARLPEVEVVGTRPITLRLRQRST